MKNSKLKTKMALSASVMSCVLALPLTATATAEGVKSSLSITNKGSTVNNAATNAHKTKINTRKQIVKEAADAAKATQTALIALNNEQPKQAVAALQVASGNLHLLLARDPSLAMLPIDYQVQIIEGVDDLKTIKILEEELDDLVDDNYYQAARPIMDSLVDEIRVTTVYLPLATYPAAIDATAPLIDAGKFDEAKQILYAALDTFVMDEEITPLSIIRAEDKLSEAFQIEHKGDLSKQETKDKISNLVYAANENIKVAEALGYGTEDDFEALYDSMDALKKSIGTAGFKGEWAKVKKLYQRLKIKWYIHADK